jgi:hypothetical protein
LSEGAFLNGFQKSLFLSVLHAGFDQVAHL